MLRATLYDSSGTRNDQSIARERVYRNWNEWDLDPDKAMKIWFEFPESTRYARTNYDILYTPIFFANEGITGDLCLEANNSIASEILEMTAEVYVKGAAIVGLMSIAGRPANIYDSRYSLPNLGFRPILTIETINIYDTLNLDQGPYDRGSVVGRRVPFTLPLPSETLQELHEMAPSLKSISSDTHTTMEALQATQPTMMITVRYVIEGYLVKNNLTKQKIDQEIRIFVALETDQIPSPLPELTEEIHQHRRMSVVPLSSRRPSIFSRKSNKEKSKDKDPNITRRQSVHEGGDHVIIETDDPSPLTFQTHSDAAATQINISLTYSSSGDGPGSSSATSTGPPGPAQASVEWLLKSLSSIAVQTTRASQPEGTPPSDEAFHLRSRILPVRKLKLSWTDWEPVDPDEGLPGAWRSNQTLWLTQPTIACLTPTFRTSYLSHTYSVWISLNVSGRSFKSKSYKVELNVPVKVRYDIGLAPTYSIDRSLPMYTAEPGGQIEGERDPFVERARAAAAAQGEGVAAAPTGTAAPNTTAEARASPLPTAMLASVTENEAEADLEITNATATGRRRPWDAPPELPPSFEDHANTRLVENALGNLRIGGDGTRH